MDLYSYFKERFSWGSNPYTSVEKCRQVVDELLLNPIIPHRISAEAAVCFLSAVRDFAGDGCFLSAEFATVMGSLIGELHTMSEAVEAADEAFCQEAADAGQGEAGGPLYTPGDYEVRQVDLDGNERSLVLTDGRYDAVSGLIESWHASVCVPLDDMESEFSGERLGNGSVGKRESY